jgi:hypothetical protein
MMQTAGQLMQGLMCMPSHMMSYGWTLSTPMARGALTLTSLQAFCWCPAITPPTADQSLRWAFNTCYWRRYLTWDSSLFPQPVDLQEDVASRGRRMVTIVDPHVKRDPSYYIFQVIQPPREGKQAGNRWLIATLPGQTGQPVVSSSDHLPTTWKPAPTLVLLLCADTMLQEAEQAKHYVRNRQGNDFDG